MKYILILIALLLLVGLFVFMKPKKKIFTSPNGDFTLTISESKSKATMPGGGGSKANGVHIILKDKNGKVISNSDNYPKCNDVTARNIDIEWDLDNNVVKYGLARYIHLETGEMMC